MHMERGFRDCSVYNRLDNLIDNLTHQKELSSVFLCLIKYFKQYLGTGVA